jgi:hypothetical protein
MDQPPANSLPSLPLSAKGRRTTAAPVSALMAAALANPDLINLAAGFVDAATLPVQECAAISARIFGDASRGRAALQYDTTLGLRPLREAVLTHLERLEGKSADSMSLSADQIVITTGSQQMLYLIADVLLDPGDIVITANPSYFVFSGVLESLGAKVLAVPMDEQGMDVEAVGGLLLIHDVTLFVTSHIHAFFQGQWGRTPYIITGGGGAELRGTGPDNNFHHYLILYVDGQETRWELRKVDPPRRPRLDRFLYDLLLFKEGFLPLTLILITGLLTAIALGRYLYLRTGADATTNNHTAPAP